MTLIDKSTRLSLT